MNRKVVFAVTCFPLMAGCLMPAYGSDGATQTLAFPGAEAAGAYAQGTRLMQVYAGSSVCAPSRCVLMTGLHTGRAPVRDNHGKREVVPPGA